MENRLVTAEVCSKVADEGLDFPNNKQFQSGMHIIQKGLAPVLTQSQLAFLDCYILDGRSSVTIGRNSDGSQPLIENQDVPHASMAIDDNGGQTELAAAPLLLSRHEDGSVKIELLKDNSPESIGSIVVKSDGTATPVEGFEDFRALPGQIARHVLEQMVLPVDADDHIPVRIE
jgi:hypothetical protein